MRVTTRTEASAAALRAQGVEARAIEHDSDGERVGGRGRPTSFVLGVKPLQITDLLARGQAAALDPEALVVSVAAGVTTASMEDVVDRTPSCGPCRTPPRSSAAE